MWLINTGNYHLEEFNETTRPKYAILSHVWASKEVTFQDIKDLPTAQKQPHFEKIKGACMIARQDGYKWIWIDSCCIDKTSSAELSEAINSMFLWYSDAEVCYAFLADVRADENPGAESSSFRRAKWFTRGWTLQELIASRTVIFLSKKWTRMGTKRTLANTIEAITLVDRKVLLHEILLDDVCVARRMSWASLRETTRIEDRAYSLMGIFGVNMPAIYGEGPKAFIRLQLEIFRQSPDQTIFAWGTIHDYDVLTDNAHSLSDGDAWLSEYRGLLAPTPALFQHSANVTALPLESFAERVSVHIPVPEYAPTNYGIHIHLPVCTVPGTALTLALLAALDRGHVLALLLRRRAGTRNRFYAGLYGLFRPLAQPWHPYFRVFRFPRTPPAPLAVADAYIHSHNPSPERSRIQGVAGKQLRLHAHRAQPPAAPPDAVAFVVPGWKLKELSTAGFRLSSHAGGEKAKQARGWAPQEAWSDAGGDLTLLLSAREPSVVTHGVVVFRTSRFKEVFAIAIGMHGDRRTLWAEVLIRHFDAPGKEVQWGRDGQEMVRNLWARYEGLSSDEASELSIEKWHHNQRKFGDGKRTVKLSFTSWDTAVSEQAAGSTTSKETYTVGVELAGTVYEEASHSSAVTTQDDTASTLSKVVNTGKRIVV